MFFHHSGTEARSFMELASLCLRVSVVRTYGRAE